MKAFTLRHTALSLALALAHAQGAWAGTTTVALSGQFAPGLGVIGRFSTFEAPLLNAAGQVAFEGSINGSGINANNNAGIWSNSGLIARTGTAAPGAGSGASFASFSGLQLNAAGQVAYEGKLVGSSVTAANDTGIWRNNTLLVRTGHAAPGAGAGTTFSDFFGYQLNAAGQVAFGGLLTGPGVDANNRAGIWQGSTLIARKGSAAPEAGVGVTFRTLGALALNASGNVAFQAQLAGEGVNIQNDSGIWRDDQLIVRAGDPIPNNGAVVLSSVNAPQINAAGQVSFQSLLRPSGLPEQGGYIGIGSRTEVAKSGTVAPGTDGSGIFTSFAAHQLNAAGQVAFTAVLRGASVNASNDVGIWRDGTLIAREGNAAPGTASGVSYSGLGNAQLNAGGQVAFRSTLSGTGVTASNSFAWFLGDGEETILVARNGDALAGSTITSLSASTASFNDKAQFAYRATLADGRSGVFLFTPTLHWRSSTGGSWDDASKWTLGLNPGDVYDVAIDASNSLRINGPTGAVTLKSLQVGTGAGLMTLQMTGGSIDATAPIVIGPRGVLTGTGSFARQVLNQGTVQAERLLLSEGLSNAGLVRGVAGGPRAGAGLEADLFNQASGRVLVQPGETLQLRGTSHRNLGVFEINQGRLEVAGSLLNASGGVIDLNRATALADGAWTNAAGARILLDNARLTISGGLNNAGQVLVTSGDSDVFGAVTNQSGGQILLSGQGTTTFYDAVELQAGSKLSTSPDATAVFFGAVAQRSGALLSGTGHKYFEGGFSVGDSPGLGEDGGDVSFGAANVYLAEIGGTELGSSYDHYRVAGTLTLGGTLKLASIAGSSGFSGQAGQSFDLFDWGSLQGQFSQIDSSGLLLAEGAQLDLSRLYIDGVIGVTAVPEPAQWALMLLGGVSLLAWRRRPLH